MPKVVIAPNNVAAFPQGGGHFWVFLQYALALQQLGCDVYWLEAFLTNGRPEQEAAALATFRARMERFGLGQRVLLYPIHNDRPVADAPTEYLDRARAEVDDILAGADLLVNFHYAMNPALLSRFRRTALVDIDPGLLQFWITRSQLRVPRHDLYFTIGEHVGSPGGMIPDCGLEWFHIRPAVFLPRWPYAFDPRCERFTTVSIWDSRDWIVDRSEQYENTKRSAFLQMVDLPCLTRQPLELALFLKNPRDFEDARNLEHRGWRVRLSQRVTATPGMYQAHIQQSRGEFGCAKPSYRKFQTAWVSDRTVCYLASGKPVVVQDTGPSGFLPDGEGMFRFSTPAQAAAAFETINADYERHCRAARRIAETHFDATKILAGLLSDALA